MIDLGNERDVADYVLRAHGCLRSSASASVDGGDGGGYETAASEVSSVVENTEIGEEVRGGRAFFGCCDGGFDLDGLVTRRWRILTSGRVQRKQGQNETKKSSIPDFRRERQ